MLKDYTQIIQLIIASITVIIMLYKIFAWVTKMNQNIDKILKEVTTNSGSSLKDKVTSIDTQFIRNSKTLNQILDRQRWLLNLREEPIFELDVNGQCTWVNEKYCQLLKHDVDYFLNNGWRSAIHPDDRERFTSDWDSSISDKRSVELSVRLIDREGNVFNVRFSLTKTDESGYMGTIKTIK